MEAAPRGSSSTSIGELWPDIDKLDEAAHDGASVWNPRGDLPPGPSFERSNQRMVENAGHTTRRVSVSDTKKFWRGICERQGGVDFVRRPWDYFSSYAEIIHG
jgi:hypothetical protein